MDIWKIVANVRKVGAIGIFYKSSFTLVMPTGKDASIHHAEFFDRLISTYGYEYEFNGISSIVMLEKHPEMPAPL